MNDYDHLKNHASRRTFLNRAGLGTIALASLIDSKLLRAAESKKTDVVSVNNANTRTGDRPTRFAGIVSQIGRAHV